MIPCITAPIAPIAAIAAIAPLAFLALGCASLGFGGAPVPTAGELTIVNDTDETICFVPIHPVSAPTQERDILRLLREDPIKPHSRRRFRRGDVALLNVEGKHRLTMLSCGGLASPVEEIDFADGAVVKIDTF